LIQSDTNLWLFEPFKQTVEKLKLKFNDHVTRPKIHVTRKYKLPTMGVFCLSNQDKFMVCGVDKAIGFVFQTKSQELSSLQNQFITACEIYAESDCSYVFLGTDHGVMEVWKFKNNELKFKCKTQTAGYITNIVYEPNGEVFITHQDHIEAFEIIDFSQVLPKQPKLDLPTGTLTNFKLISHLDSFIIFTTIETENELLFSINTDQLIYRYVENKELCGSCLDILPIQNSLHFNALFSSKMATVICPKDIPDISPQSNVLHPN
jgi:hypothetical protein